MKPDRHTERVELLQARFRAIAAGPMRDLPISHPGLPVEAIGFAPDDLDPAWAMGVLLTPWCLNLVRLPLDPAAATLPVGHPASRRVSHDEAEGELAFIGAHDDNLGGYETCSLFSPMQAFADADTARATAREVLAQLRRPVSTTRPVKSSPDEGPAAPGRRGFLFGLRGT
ncbi:[NiFe]-hydrogenase assembly chaperone HybE [Leptothrix discophora]|uniref:[NiFe]-hydrogenase assembly chaperone HybE n=1 Tax=Leptothrix discophora TaxID=89 RepID=A0ABT9G1C3_LEPDI|nr:[NiFe]-hydrogenase assembly chaperone HybE [Leptothrix discophora]MDP4300286.1 [NiFe]-hydrogenase assembly chaperone HybE [Leptothrix discophora]